MTPRGSPHRAPRFFGFDDAPFTFDDADCLVVGVATRGASPVEGVLTTRVAVDGRDATSRLMEALAASRHTANLRAVLLDGVTFGGFNLIDGAALAEATGVPVVALTRKQPDPAAARMALEDHFEDWRERWRLLESRQPQRITVAGGTLWGVAWGIDVNAVPALLAAATHEGNWPECLRLAHMMGQAVVQGESRNKA